MNKEKATKTDIDKPVIKLPEKLSYGCGDFASSMFWKLFSMYLMFFYTDVFGISAAAVGSMFLFTRIWDTASDPIMGLIADRTESRWGKYRPYLLFVAIPFAIIGIITFSTPDLSSSGKLIYAYVTYTLMMTVYTVVNVPYATLMGVMTNDPKQRTSLASYRMIGAFAGGLFVTSTANYFISTFGSGSTEDPVGFKWTITLYAILAAIFFILTFLGTKERLEPMQSQSSLKDDLKDLGKNYQWFIMLGAGVSTLIFNSLRDGSIMYYFKYYVQEQTVAFLNFEYTVGYEILSSAYMTIWLGTNIIGVLLAKPISDRIGKRKTFMLSAIASAIFSFALFFMQPHNLILIFASNILIGISAGIVLPLIWSMFADIADWSEWKTGRRATGLIFSSSSMSQKLGWTLGGALTGWMLALFNFEANVQQTSESLLGIRLIISVFAGLGALLAAAIIYFYKLDDETMQQIEMELEEARAASEESE